MSDLNVIHLAIAPPKEVRRDLKKNFPWLIWIATGLLVYILGSSAFASYLEKWTYLHAAYFTVINTTTVGFGDVVPVTRLGKLLAGANALVGLTLFGSFVAALTMALQPSGYSGTVTLPTEYGKVPEFKRESDIESSAEDLLRALGGLVKVGSDQFEKQETQDHHGRARIRIRHHNPHYVAIDIDIDIDIIR